MGAQARGILHTGWGRVTMEERFTERGRMMLECLFVGLGGFIGSVARYLIGLLAVETASGFPVKTFCINLLGSFILGIAGSWDLAESGAVFADWRLRGLHDVFNVFERGAEAFRWWASGGGACLYGAFCGAGIGLLLWGLAGGADALTKNEHTVWNDPDGVLVFYSSAGCQRALMVFP